MRFRPGGEFLPRVSYVLVNPEQTIRQATDAVIPHRDLRLFFLDDAHAALCAVAGSTYFGCMRSCPTTVVLGSRSPRRLELLQLLIPADSIRVLPPKSRQESGFDGLDDWPSIESRLAEIAHTKCDDVLAQLKAQSEIEIDEQSAAVLTADTIIVVSEENGRLRVLGQPPEDDTWCDVVRDWFHRYYLGRTHTAATAICVATPAGRRVERVVTSRVTFHDVDAQTESRIEWYLATGESQGKAGGYALQGAGGVFIAAVEGSVNNVVGLPLRELLSAMSELGIDVAAINN